jgi:hypothetical protein
VILLKVVLLVEALCYKPEVAGSSPDAVIDFFNLPNKPHYGTGFHRNMYEKMFLESRARSAHKIDSFAAINEPIVWTMWYPQHLKPYRPSRPVTGIVTKCDRAFHYDRDTTSEMGWKERGETYTVSFLLQSQNLLPVVCDWVCDISHPRLALKGSPDWWILMGGREKILSLSPETSHTRERDFALWRDRDDHRNYLRLSGPKT